jgi:S-adenosylmethionine:tRNA ribosyltransferase-isomerase
MRIDWFDYELPSRLIAEEPLAERDRSRLLVVGRNRSTIAHQIFQDLPDLLTPGDLLVLNDTKVVPARLRGFRAKTGGRWEGLFLNTNADGAWELLCQTRGRLGEGERIIVEPGPLQLTLHRKAATGHWLAQPEGSNGFSTLELLERHGQVPLPPYLRKGRATAPDRERYQTVFARHAGAVAAPTAGLHFTPRLFERLEERGIRHSFVTLHVGVGTFQPIQVEQVAEHRMHQEWAALPAATAAAITSCRERGNRVVAVGTTSVRVLETVAASGDLRPWSGETDLFIYPPYQFRAVDALITNFHLPRSSLLLLVGAFGGIEPIRKAYQAAVDLEYRFYSYGDAMLILDKPDAYLGRLSGVVG